MKSSLDSEGPLESVDFAAADSAIKRALPRLRPIRGLLHCLLGGIVNDVPWPYGVLWLFRDDIEYYSVASYSGGIAKSVDFGGVQLAHDLLLQIVNHRESVIDKQRKPLERCPPHTIHFDIGNQSEIGLPNGCRKT